MSHDREVGLSPFDVSHHVNLAVAGATYGHNAEVHRRVKPREGYGEVKPWSVDVAECDWHVLSLNRQSEAYDRFNGSYTYIGKCKSQKDAYSRWVNYLLSIGVHAENAVMLND